MAWFLPKKRLPPKDLEELLCKTYWLKREQVWFVDDVFRELRMAGDDCFEFMQEIAEHFAVDISQYDWTKYHYSEGEELDWFGGIYRAIFSIFGEKWPDRDRPIYPISTLHLIKVCQSKRWTDPEPMPPPRARRKWLAFWSRH